MNAKIANDVNAQMVEELIKSARVIAQGLDITEIEAIDRMVAVKVKNSSNATEVIAWELIGNEAKSQFLEAFNNAISDLESKIDEEYDHEIAGLI